MRLEDLFIISTGYLRSRVKGSLKVGVFTKKHFDFNMSYLENDEINEDDIIFINQEHEDRLTKEGDIIVDSLSKKACVITKETDGLFVLFNYFILRDSKIDKDYFTAWFNLSDEANIELNKVLHGSVIQKLSLSQLRSLTITLPPGKKQELIGKLYKESNKRFNASLKIKENEEDIIRNVIGDNDGK